MSENKIERQIFTYSFIFRFIFRFGNFLLTPIVVLYTVPLVYYLDEKTILAFPLIVNLLIIYFLNKHYLNLYKILPYKIEADNEKLTCSDFFLSPKIKTIYYDDISALSGGIFDNKISGIMKIRDERNNFSIGFYHKLGNSQKLATIILSKVKRELYDEVLEKIQSRKGELKK